MAPLRHYTSRRQKVTEIPLTKSGWTGKQSTSRMNKSHAQADDSSSAELGMEDWMATLDTINTRNDIQKDTRRPQGSQNPRHGATREVTVTNNASADPRLSADSTLPINQIKVSKDMVWSSEQTR